MDKSVRLLFKMEDTSPIKIEKIEVLVDDKYEKKVFIWTTFLSYGKEQREQYESNYLTEEHDWKANWLKSSKEEYKFNNINKRPNFYSDGLIKKNPSLWLNDDMKK